MYAIEFFAGMGAHLEAIHAKMLVFDWCYNAPSNCNIVIITSSSFAH